jgi:asparagine synthase (glutamine-hydrolysing)
MCGICGFFSLYAHAEDFYLERIKKISDTLIHRGPDDSGYWIDIQNNIAFGHRRLAVIDLKSTGHQPMFSSQGQFVIIYNGEIYNYLELKKELDKEIVTDWQGHSDTEVLLRGFEHWGIKNTLEKTCGMFAFALFDRKNKKLFLARDRMGEKPLYYGWVDDLFYFGSELKIIDNISRKKLNLDLQALGSYFRYGYVPAPASIFQEIKKVLPGTYIELDLANFKPQVELKYNEYWAARDYFNCRNNINVPINELQNKLENILEEVISQALISDVPVGAFLSGGVDSSLLAAIMQKVSPGKVKSFTIGFNENKFNEAPYAAAISKHLGTDHTELYLTSNDCLNIIPKLSRIYDEPFADSSQIPTILVSELTKTKVTVALSGDGGDELFAGYQRYLAAKKMQQLRKHIPDFLGKFMGSIILGLPNLVSYENKICEKFGITRIWHLIRKAAEIFKVPAENIYECFIAQYPLSEEIMLSGVKQNFLQNKYGLNNIDNITQMMYIDMMSYLPDDIMVKVDRAAMSVSLETRAPFLDRRVVEFVCSLPLQAKLKNGITKNILRNILYKYVPKELLDRPKRGFGVPIASWLRGPLKEWAGDLLAREMLAKHNYLDVNLIERKWHEHLSGKGSFSYFLWEVLMFQAWYSEYLK